MLLNVLIFDFNMYLNALFCLFLLLYVLYKSTKH